MRILCLLVSLLLLLSAGCADDGSPADATPPDAAIEASASDALSPSDSLEPDKAAEDAAPDSEAPDSGADAASEG